MLNQKFDCFTDSARDHVGGAREKYFAASPPAVLGIFVFFLFLWQYRPVAQSPSQHAVDFCDCEPHISRLESCRYHLLHHRVQCDFTREVLASDFNGVTGDFKLRWLQNRSLCTRRDATHHNALLAIRRSSRIDSVFNEERRPPDSARVMGTAHVHHAQISYTTSTQ